MSRHSASFARTTILSCAVLAAMTAHAADTTFPNRPIRMVIPFAPGASNDITARLIAPKMSENMGHPVVVDNRPGAGGVVGAELTARAIPDGYTVLMGSPGPLTINPAMIPNLTYSPKKDFAPVTLVAVVPLILQLHPNVPAKSVKELIGLVRATPGKYNYASAGVGSMPHFAGELFKLLSKLDMTHVPYKGSAPAITDLIGGQVSMFFDNMASAVPYVKSGRLRALAITTPKRSDVLPDVPTMNESGVPGYEAYSWNGIVAPVGTPRPVLEKIAKEVAAAVGSPDIREKMKGLGAEVIASSPAEFAEFMDRESAKWGRVVREANIKPE